MKNKDRNLKNVFLFGSMAMGFFLRIDWLLKKHIYYPNPFYSDEYNYYISTAISAFRGNGFSPYYNEVGDGIFVPPPLQSIFILGFFKITNQLLNPYYIKIVQILLSTLSIYFAYQIGKDLRGVKAGLILALLVALNPVFVFWPAFLLTESNYLTGLIFFTFLFIKWAKNPTFFLGLCTCATLGLLNLQRGISLLLAPVLGVLVFFLIRTKKGLLFGTLFVLVPALFVTPWLIRNLVVYQEPILVSSNSGVLFHFANRITLDARKTIYWETMRTTEKPGPLLPEIEAKYRKDNGKLNVTYHQYSKVYLQIALRYIARHPFHFSKNMLIKFFNQFWYVQKEPYRSVGFLNHISLIYFVHYFLLFGGMWGGWLLIRGEKTPEKFLILSSLGYFSIVGSFFHLTLDGRMNLYLKFFLCIFLAIALDHWVGKSSYPAKFKQVRAEALF